MKTDNGFAIAFFAAAVGGAVALAIANDITAPLCEAAKIKSMAPDRIEFGCLEFWLNRYQTTLQTIISGGIGAAGLFFILRQLAALGHQNEMTRAALEMSLGEAKRSERLMRLRARQAVRNIGSRAFMLQFDALKAFSPKRQQLEYDMKAYIPKEEEQIAIFSALVSQAEIDRWNGLMAEYTTLVSFIGAKKEDIMNIWRGENIPLPALLERSKKITAELNTFGDSLVGKLD